MPIERRCALPILAAPLLLAGARPLASPAQPQTYRARPERMIVPCPAGGPCDVMPRLVT